MVFRFKSGLCVGKLLYDLPRFQGSCELHRAFVIDASLASCGLAAFAFPRVSGGPGILSDDVDLQPAERRVVKFSFSAIARGHSRTEIGELGKILGTKSHASSDWPQELA